MKKIERIAEEITQKINDKEGYLDDDQWDICFSAVKDGIRKGIDLMADPMNKSGVPGSGDVAKRCVLKELEEEEK